MTLASLNAAKGLEWDAVFVVGVVDGTIPITHASTPAQVEEERRLLYVGITRAREQFTLVESEAALLEAAIHRPSVRASGLAQRWTQPIVKSGA